MKKNLLLFTLLFTSVLFAQNPPPNQAQPIIKTQSFSSVGVGEAISTGPGVSTHSLSWTSNNNTALTGCAIGLDGSPDGTHWVSAGIISSADCNTVTIPATVTVSGISANYVRVHILSLNAGNIGVTYTGTVTGTMSSGSSGPSGPVLWGEITGTLANQVDLAAALVAKAPLNSPVFIGNPQAPTPLTNDNSTSVATTQWVRNQGYGGGGTAAWGAITGVLSNQVDLQNALNLLSPLASPALTGNPTAPTQTLGNSSTRLANTAFVQSQIAASAPGLAPVQSVAAKTGAVTLVEGDIAGLTLDLSLKAPSASPALTGSPTAPTPLTGDSSAAIATTAFVKAQNYLVVNSVNVVNNTVNNPNFSNTLPAVESGFVLCKYQFSGSNISSECPFGVSGSTFAVGNDSRIVGAEQSANKNQANGYAGLDGSSKIAGTQQVYGTAINTAAQGNDARIVNSTPQARNINTVNSLAGGGDLTQDRSLQLVNDTSAPGNTKYYGTNSSGVKGWFDLTSSTGIGSINSLNANAQFITFSGDSNLNAAINSASNTHALTIGLVGPIPKNKQFGTTVYTDQANAYSAGIQDYSSAIALVVPTGPGAAPTLNARIAYDTSSNTYFGGTNGFSQRFAMSGGANDIVFTTAFQIASLHLNPTPTLCGAGTSSRGIDANGNGTGCFTPSGSGNVTGPGSAVDNNLASYNGITGTIIKDSGIAAANVVTEAVAAGGAGFLLQSAGASKAISTTSIATNSVPTTCVNDTNLQCSINTSNQITMIWAGTVPAGRLNTNVVQSFTNDANLQITIAAQNGTIAWVGTLPKNRIIGTAVYNDQANTYSTGLQDLTAATMNVPASAGYAPTTSKTFGYNTTSNLYVGGANGVAKVFAFTDSSITGNAATATALAANPTDCSANQFANAIAANGNLTCAQVAYAQVTGTPTLAYQLVGVGGTSQTVRNRTNYIAGTNITITPADNSGTNSTDVTINSTAGGLTNPMTAQHDIIEGGASGPGTPVRVAGPTTYDGVPQVLVAVSTAGVTSSLAWSVTGVPVNALSSATPALLYTHRASLINTTNGTGSTAFSIPAAGSATFDVNFPFVNCNLGTALNTATPTTSTVNGNATLKLQGYAGAGNNPECAFWWSDNSNYTAAVILPTDANGRLQASGMPAFTGDATNTAGTLAMVVSKVNGGVVAASSPLVGTNVSGQIIPVTTIPTSTVPAFTGDMTNSAGSLATTVVKVNGGSIPASAALVGTNGGSQFTALTVLPTTAEPAHTGDVTNTAGNLTLSLVNIPVNTPVAGNLLATVIVAPSTPAAGKGSIYVDSTSKNLAVKDDAGVVKHGAQTKAVVGSQFLTGMNDAGVFTGAQPAFTDISGVATTAQLPAATVYNNAANTATSAMTLDLGAASATAGLIVPKAPGAVPVNDGAVSVNTTNHTLVHGLNGTTTLVSAVAATGTGTATTCTNQVITAISGISVPTCSTLVAAMTDTSIAHTGVDINTSYQVTVTHLASALPFAQGGFGTATAVSGGVPYGSSTSGIAFSALLAANYPVVGGGAGAAPATVSLAPSTQTDGATVTWALGSAWAANATLTFTVHSGSRTLNITNPLAGSTYFLRLVQDATGGEGLILGTGCTWKVSGGGAGAITLSTGANAVDMLAFYYDGTNCYANLNKNFS